MTAGNDTSIRVLMVEDDEDFRVPTARFLDRVGMTVEEVVSAEDMYVRLNTFAPDVIVLDINLPGEDGFTAAQRLRELTGAGIVMLTARGSLDDRVQGLKESADSYLTKPVDMRELEAVIHAVKRRVEQKTIDPEIGWVFDSTQWTLTSPEGNQCKLSAAEHKLLSKLLAEPGVPVERNKILASFGKGAAGPDDRSLDVLVSRLRQKFTSPTCPLPIKSVRGVGYVFPRPAFKIDWESAQP